MAGRAGELCAPAREQSVEEAGRRVETYLGAVGELLAAFTILAAFVPGTSDTHDWFVPAGLLVVTGAVAVVRARSLPKAALPLVAYLAVYALVALHGPSPASDDVARYLLRPLIGLAVAALPFTSRARRRLILLILVLAGIEALVAVVQASSFVIRYGRHATDHVDGVTGTLGVGQAGVLGFFCLLAAVIVVSWWLHGGARAAAGVAVGAAMLAGIATSTRAIVFVVPALVVVWVAALLLLRVRTVDRRRLAVLAAVGLALGPALYGAIAGLYPGAFASGFASQNAAVLGGIPAPAKRANGHGHGNRQAAPAGPSGVALLPGRLAQIRLALRLSGNDGVGTFLLGRGMGSSKLDPAITTPSSVPLPERTGPTWIGRVLTEGGWLALGAFLGLLLWLTLLAGPVVRPARSAVDRVLATSLPAVAALTLVGAVDTTILDVRAYSLPFWVVVGLAVGFRTVD